MPLFDECQAHLQLANDLRAKAAVISQKRRADRMVEGLLLAIQTTPCPSATEREWFRLLQTVQGVGTKVALVVLSTLKPADLASAIAMRDKAALTRAPGSVV
jgi:hypothetical protein